MSYVVMFTLHAKPGHYAQLADTYSAFAAGFLSSHPALESVLVVGDEASGVLRGVGIYTSKDAADGVNSDPQFAAFNDSIAEMVATPPERVELELLHLFAAGLTSTNEQRTPDRDRLDRNRAVWSQVNAQFTDGDAEARWRAPDFAWGLFGIPEAELDLLGDVGGARVVELGCGTAYVSAWLARAGADVVGVDLSPAQLSTARRCQQHPGPVFPLVEANAEHVPLRSGAFDLVVSEYGASPWCDPERWIPEAARLLRTDGRLVFLTNSVLAALCVPDSEGFAGERLLRSQAEVARIAWPGGGVEHHLGHGEWIRVMHDAGLVVDALHELSPSDGATPEYYDIATADWASRWPAEDVWVAHRS